MASQSHNSDNDIVPLAARSSAQLFFRNPWNARTRIDYSITYEDGTVYNSYFFGSSALKATWDKRPRLTIDDKVPADELTLSDQGESVLVTGKPKGEIRTAGGNDILLVLSRYVAVNASMGNGNDMAIAAQGNDTLHGNAGDDFLDGNAGNDRLWGDAGNDTLRGGIGNDSLFGGGGNDLVYAGAGQDTLNGGADNDALFGNEGNDLINGGTGNDILAGDAGNDELHGDKGNDTLIGGTASDILWGDEGNDLFRFEYLAGCFITIKDFTKDDRIDLTAFANTGSSIKISKVNNNASIAIDMPGVGGIDVSILVEGMSFTDFTTKKATYIVGVTI